MSTIELEKQVLEQLHAFHVSMWILQTRFGMHDWEMCSAAIDDMREHLRKLALIFDPLTADFLKRK